MVNKLCSNCKYFIYGKVGIPEEYQYHCRFGFRPFVGFLNTFSPPMPYDCREEAKKIAINLPIVERNLFD